MEPKVIVMIVQLAMPNGEANVHVKPMENVAACRKAAEIEASDPFVIGVACSRMAASKLEMSLKLRDKGRKLPETSNFKSTG